MSCLSVDCFALPLSQCQHCLPGDYTELAAAVALHEFAAHLRHCVTYLCYRSQLTLADGVRRWACWPSSPVRSTHGLWLVKLLVAAAPWWTTMYSKALRSGVISVRIGQRGQQQTDHYEADVGLSAGF